MFVEWRCLQNAAGYLVYALDESFSEHAIQCTCMFYCTSYSLVYGQYRGDGGGGGGITGSDTSMPSRLRRSGTCTMYQRVLPSYLLVLGQ